jgi:hypothetical protein
MNNRETACGGLKGTLGRYVEALTIEALAVEAPANDKGPG